MIWAPLSAVFNFCLGLPAAGADHQAPLAAFPPVLTSQTSLHQLPPPPQRISPSCCGSSGQRSPSTCSSCSSSAWPVWFPWRRRTTAATTPTTSLAPSIPCCATPTDLRPYEEQLIFVFIFFKSTYCFAKDSTDSCECFLFTLCPKGTNSSPLLGMYYEVFQRWHEDCCHKTLHTHPLTWVTSTL